MFRKLIGLVIALCLLPLSLAWAQEDFNLKTTIETHVLPEYDNQEVLVINSIEYTNTADQPYQGLISFPVPKGSSTHIVKEMEDKEDSHVVVKVEEKDQYAVVVWQPTKPVAPQAKYPVHLEYYYSPLPAAGVKEFSFSFYPTYPIEMAKYYIYQPLKATDFKVEPAAQMLGKDGKGFNVYGLDFPGLVPGGQVEFKVAYVKEDPNPSLGQGENGTVPPLVNTLRKAGIWAAGALVLGGILLFVRRNAKQETSAAGAVAAKGSFAEEKQRLKALLVKGIITEEAYQQQLIELEERHAVNGTAQDS